MKEYIFRSCLKDKKELKLILHIEQRRCFGAKYMQYSPLHICQKIPFALWGVQEDLLGSMQGSRENL
jgi:hypothetical protein